MTDMLIRHATIVTMNPARDIIEDGLIAINGSKLSFVGTELDAPFSLKECPSQIDASGRAVFPGLVNMHTHSYQSLIKGLASDKPLDEWLAEAALPAADHLDEASAEAGALICALENIRSGVTTLVDMFPRIEPAIFDAVMKGYDRVGISPIFAAGFMHDEEAGLSAEEIEVSLESLIEHASRNKHPLMLAPFQVWNNSAESLLMSRRLAKKHGLRTTTHALETPFDAASTRARHGVSELEALQGAGLLNEQLCLVHGVNCSEEEMGLISEHDASLCYSPVCNAYLGSGFAPIPSLLSAGVRICLGTEGAGCNNSNNMLETMKWASLMQKAAWEDPSCVNAQEVLEMATVNGAAALGLSDSIGSIEISKDADLFILDPYADPAATPMHDPVSTLVYSATPRNITDVFVKGNHCLKGGAIGSLDEHSALSACGKEAMRLAEQAGIS